MSGSESNAELVVAHRGHARVAPENTLAAVRGALAAGARYLEVDVQLAADGTPFLFHDRTLERLCGVRGSLGELSTGAVAALRACEPGRFGRRFADERVPSLEQLAACLAAQPAAHVYVELKRASLERFGPERVLEAVLPRLGPLIGRFTLISFDLQVLALARRCSDAPVGPVLATWAQRAEPQTRALRPDVVFCNVLRLPAEGPLDAAGGLPAPLVVYEIDEPVHARALFARGAAQVESFAVADLLRGLAAEGADGPA